jgi:hypothetical protein
VLRLHGSKKRRISGAHELSSIGRGLEQKKASLVPDRASDLRMFVRS